MSYPVGFPHRLMPAADEIILEADRAFPKENQAKARISQAFFKLCDLTCEAAETGEWSVHLASEGIKVFLDWLCQHDKGAFWVVGNPIEFDQWAIPIKQEILRSDEWLACVKKLAAMGRGMTNPFTGQLSIESKYAQSGRLKSTVSSPAAARRLEKYLQERGIGLTDFASKAQTTDRTLRAFRKTGKVRRDIFESIAKAMGTTKDDLLKG